jgi:lipoic acid synthetase
MIKAANPRIRSKSGVMAGLGETRRGMEMLMDDLRGAGCEFLTIGQYLAPSPAHCPVAEYVHPDVFDSYRETALKKGFDFVASAPFVRSSYNAGEALSRPAP